MSGGRSKVFTFGMGGVYLTVHSGVFREQPGENTSSAVLGFSGPAEMALFNVSEQVVRECGDGGVCRIDAGCVQSIPGGGPGER